LIAQSQAKGCFIKNPLPQAVYLGLKGFVVIIACSFAFTVNNDGADKTSSFVIRLGIRPYQQGVRTLLVFTDISQNIGYYLFQGHAASAGADKLHRMDLL